MLQLRRRPSSFAPPPSALERQLAPVISTMVASLLPIVPLVADTPILPPLGLVVFIAWRMRRADIWPLWMGLPLGLFDDLVSGQPLGTAMAGWTLLLLALDALDGRMAFRNARQDWMTVAAALLAQIVWGWAIAGLTGGATPLWLMLPGGLIALLLWPMAARTCAALDQRSSGQ